jgi:hypothetical protein
MDYMLRTNTKEEMNQALLAASLLIELQDIENQTILYPISNIAIDHIGPIIKPPVLDEYGVEITPSTSDNRWHTNIRVDTELTEEQIAALPTFDPLPTIPYRVFI